MDESPYTPVPRNRRGFTLMELILALALFAIVLGSTAQALVNYYAAIEMQDRRATAIQNCRGILAQMRELRDDPTAAFPAAIIQRWPDAAAVPGAGTLQGEQITVRYTDVTENPLEILVRSTFTDLHGRPVVVQIGTALTGE